MYISPFNGILFISPLSLCIIILRFLQVRYYISLFFRVESSVWTCFVIGRGSRDISVDSPLSSSGWSFGFARKRQAVETLRRTKTNRLIFLKKNTLYHVYMHMCIWFLLVFFLGCYKLLIFIHCCSLNRSICIKNIHMCVCIILFNLHWNICRILNCVFIHDVLFQ